MTKRLFLLSPAVVFKARVNQAAWIYPITQAKFDGVTVGAYTDIKPGMTVVFGSTDGGSEFGRQRIRKTATSDTIYFGRSSIGIRDGELFPEDNCYITVWDDYRPWSKIPLIETDGTIYKDSDLAFSDQTDDIPPKANIEPPAAAGDIGSGTSLMLVDFDGADSYALSGTIASYLWDVDDGTIITGTTTSTAITVSFPAGFRWVTLTVTDSNGKTHTMRAPVYARDPAVLSSSIHDFQIERHTIGVQGQEISLKIFESIPEGTYPDGTLVMLWDDDLSVITNGDHMTFVGWHDTDPAQIKAERTAILSEVTFNCLDMAGKLKTLPGFPISVENIDPPTSWLEMKAPNMDRYIDYLLRWHSTALELAHVTLSGTGSNYPFVILGSDASSLWEQAARRAQSLVPDYVLTCDTNGRIGMKPDPIIQAVADRTSTVQTTIDASEWSNISYTRQRAPRVHWLRSEAVLASGTEIGALFSVAPDDTPGQGVSSRTQGEQLARNQTDLNAAEGNRYARLNAFESSFRIDLAAGDRLGIEPAHMTWVQLTMSAAYAAQRGLSFTDERGLVHEISINYRYGRTGMTKDVSLTWERETDGPAAKGYIPPTIDDPDIPYEPPPDPGFNPDPVPGAGTGFGTAFAMIGNGLARTANLSATSPTWASILGSITGTLYDFILDPYAPTTIAMCLTSNGVWRTENLNDTTPTWTQVLSSSDVATGTGQTFAEFQYKIFGSINLEDYYACFARTNAAENRIYCCYTTNAGTSWSFGQVEAASNSGTSGSIALSSGADVVPRVIGGDLKLYATIYKNKGLNGQGYFIYTSSNKGATWAQTKQLVYSSDPAGGTCVIAPYKSNESGNICWVSFPGGTGATQIYKTTDGFSTYTAITLPSTTNANTTTAIKRLGVEVYAGDSNQIVVWNTENRLFRSTVGGSSFSEITYTGYVPGTHGPVSGAGGFPYSGSQYYIITASRYVFVSTDGGATWVNKTGNLQSIITTNESTVKHRKGVIVPNWTE